MDLPFIPAMHTPSIKPCQTEEGSSFMLQTYTPTHTQRHTGSKLIYAAVYYHYHQTRGSEQEPGCISPLDAHHHRLSLRCLSGCHFAGGPAGIPTPLPSSSPLFCSLYLLHSFVVSVTFCICFSSPCAIFLFCFTSWSHFQAAASSPPTPLLFLLSSSSHLVTVVTTALSVCSNLCLQIFFWASSCSFKGETVPFKHLMISETVFFQWFNHSLVHFYHSGKTSWV